MQVESTVKPSEYKIEKQRNGKMTVSFFENIEEIEKEDDTIYKYDMYSITINARANLENILEEKYDEWLEYAKSTEYDELAMKVRAKRDKLLTETDWTQCTDTALSSEMQEKYKTYRQKLRDITEQENFPYSVEYPNLPAESEEN